LRAPAALPRPLVQHRALGDRRARRPATGRAADVGTGDPSLYGRRALAGLDRASTGRTGQAGAVTPLLKFIHLGAIGVWSAGLLVLPYLFWQRRFLPVAGLDVDRLDRL